MLSVVCITISMKRDLKWPQFRVSDKLHLPLCTFLFLNTGSVNTTCDRISGHCLCRPGVGGNLCDRCLPGYFGMPRIAMGKSGCTRKINLFAHDDPLEFVNSMRLNVVTL